MWFIGSRELEQDTEVQEQGLRSSKTKNLSCRGQFWEEELFLNQAFPPGFQVSLMSGPAAATQARALSLQTPSNSLTWDQTRELLQEIGAVLFLTLKLLGPPPT